MKSSAFWDITPCSLSKVKRRCHLLLAGFLLGFFFDPEEEGDVLLRNIGYISTDHTALYPRR
jgi:hypothetical protein